MRNRKSNSATFYEDIVTEDGESEKKDSCYTFPDYFGYIFLCYLMLLLFISHECSISMPTPLRITDELLNPDSFIAERAQNDLKYLTDLGPRIVGSNENENLTVQYLKHKIEEIIKNSDSSQEIELDVQVVSGGFPILPKGSISFYSNVQNVVVKLKGQSEGNSLLLNAHFDSVPTSPGGSDDGINCAVMLEILRKLSKKNERPLNNVIFLWNGAEETGLQAAHGFITQHKWSKECKVVINLEAAGAGGKISMFQTGPDRSWLTDVYGKVPHPKAEVSSEEIFQANLIPSDTDFRIFRDFGHMVGVDMAFTRNAYRYHTKYDGFDNIPLGSFQQAGDNVLSLTENIMNNPFLSDENAPKGKVVFFDYFGGFFVTYTTTSATIINIVVSVFSVLTFLLSLRIFNLSLNGNLFFYIAQIVSVSLFGWILALISVIFLGFTLDYIGYSMSWYNNSVMILGIFSLPVFMLSSCFLLLIKPKDLSPNVNAFIQAQVIRMIWTFILLNLTLFGIRSSYNILMIVLFDTLAFMFIQLIRIHHTMYLWKLICILFNSISGIYLINMGLNFHNFFVPLMGRIGSNRNPDIIIGFSALLFTLMSLSPFYFLISLIRNTKRFYKVLGTLFVISLALVFTSFGFPYSGDFKSPAPQRYWILHSNRVFHDQDGGVIKRDSGFMMLNMDRNSPRYVKNYVDETNNVKDLKDDCKNFLLCGLPLAHPKMIKVLEYSSWISSTPPLITNPVNLEVISKTEIAPNTIRYNISISGPTHTLFFVSPKKKNHLIMLNLNENLPENLWNDREFYFFTYISGKKLVPLEVSFDVTVPQNYDGPTMDIAVMGNYVHPKHHKNTAEIGRAHV